MAREVEVRVPDMGDFKDVTVIDVLIKPGDTQTLPGVNARTSGTRRVNRLASRVRLSGIAGYKT